MIACAISFDVFWQLLRMYGMFLTKNAHSTAHVLKRNLPASTDLLRAKKSQA